MVKEEEEEEEEGKKNTRQRQIREQRTIEKISTNRKVVGWLVG